MLKVLTAVTSALFKRVFDRRSAIFRFVYFNVYPKPSSLKISHVIGAFSMIRRNVSFLQVGANDGVTGDPIHLFVRRDSWRGVLVEPLPDFYERLVSAYGGQEGLVFENVALAETAGVLPFYRVRRGEGVPEWCDALGSFMRDVVLSHRTRFPEIEAHLVVDQVRCMSVATLLQKHRIEALDLIVIDTEGYDFEIVKQLDLRRLSPAIIVFEHDHLSGEDKEACTRRLADLGYRLFRDGQNTCAFLPERLPGEYLAHVRIANGGWGDLQAPRHEN